MLLLRNYVKLNKGGKGMNFLTKMSALLQEKESIEFSKDKFSELEHMQKIIRDYPASHFVLKQIDNYWVDDNGNRWSMKNYSFEEALKHQKTLIDCSNCTNCSECSNCHHCVDCVHCSYCKSSSNCSFCSYLNESNNCLYVTYSTKCKNCSFCNACKQCDKCSHSNGLRKCFSCRHCTDCVECSDCDYCFECVGCSKCDYVRCGKDYTTNHSQYITEKIGSRGFETVFYHHEGKIKVVCGCYEGDLKEFEKRVYDTYGNLNKNPIHYNDYMREIEKVKILFGGENEEKRID